MYLETERLILRPHTPADFEDYFGYIMDSELQHMLGLHDVYDRDSARAMFQWLMENTTFIALASRENGRVIGHICIQPPYHKAADDPRLTEKRGASVTFAMATWEQRKGLMLEALQGLTAQMFREGAVDYFDCEFVSHNAASRGLQEKLGFQYLGSEQFEDEELVTNILQNPA